MWKTPNGHIALHPAQIHLLIEAAATLQPYLEYGDTLDTGIEAVDRMSAGEQALAVKQVICQATNPHKKCGELFAWNEGILHHLLSVALDELDTWEDRSIYEQQAKDLIQNVGIDPEMSREAIWMYLHEQFLHDEDYLMEDLIQSGSAEEMATSMKLLGINKTYYLHPGPSGDQNDEQAAIGWLFCLTNDPQEWDADTSHLTPKIEKLRAGQAVRLTGGEAFAIYQLKVGIACYPLSNAPKNRRLLWKAMPWYGQPMPIEGDEDDE